MESFDLVIVGAGIHGMTMLKTYREVNPKSSILVLDKGTSLGGVWAKDRLYPGLHTNNHFRTFEYSDFPMSTEGFDLENDHVPGEHVNGYLYSYAQKFDLLRHMRFGSSVESAVDEGDVGWTLTIRDETTEKKGLSKIKAVKLIIATGLTSEPFMPKMDGKDDFGAPIYHTSEFAKASNGLGPYKKVVLLSGAKFSWDIACAYASAGVQVDWVIRESGHGPCWMMPNRLTPLKAIPELLVQTRAITWMSPCIWGDADGYPSIRKFLHQHWLGRRIVDGFFNKMQHGVLAHNNYDSHPETAKLKPWDDVFFIGTNRGLLNYDRDFFELVRNGIIRVHIADITHLSDHTVHLSNDETISADILICGTGWKDAPPIKFDTERELGLPGSTSPAAWKYIPKADAEILEKCPRLQNQPEQKNYKPLTDNATETVSEPYRLYRFMVPPAFIESRTLAFAGAYRSPATTLIAQAQALWITAFLGNQIPSLLEPATSAEVALPSLDARPDSSHSETPTVNASTTTNRILYETVLHTQFLKWRYSRGFGARFPELWFDCIPYIDLLLGDVGVRNKRKGGWWSECFTPYFPKDYKGIVEEFLECSKGKL
ncbi:FAD/NAD(P)-binding domain-containing protein [Lindgomyces ingoldianus]|uniref:FAD/NAD(P)-binding domain-containing protein n=1 Tax=Lindgomyces ingoldianus TaxID=673940 RepID=A0ACB6QRP8_9PLEO|nr:FAD/NAD(P)-binding domain-containing protein [Lindgomyces ingoldianus]KAF2469606.1 FAD/NAD(P)-binding domain-containing protein [Lindgomyces ingoldianus]